MANNLYLLFLTTEQYTLLQEQQIAHSQENSWKFFWSSMTIFPKHLNIFEKFYTSIFDKPQISVGH